jgi:hypothetical protein
MKLCGDTLVDDGQLVVRQVVAQPPGVAWEVRQLTQAPARRVDQPLALEAGSSDELAMCRVVLEASLPGHHEHHARDAAGVRGVEEPPGRCTGIVEVLEHVAAEQRFETPRRNPGQIGRVDIRPEGLDGEAAGTGMRHRVGVDLEAGRAWRQHRQQIAGAATEVERRPAAEASMAPQVELPHQAPQPAALDLSLQVDGVEGNRHGW